MTPKCQSRNASCVPFRGRGPRSGEGVDGGKNDYDTLILYLIALRSGGRRLAVRTAMEHPIGALPRTPFPASRDFPSRGNERYEGKNSESYTSRTISAFSPFGGWRHHLARWEACHWILSRLRFLTNPVPLPPLQAGALWVLSNGAMSLQESIERFILSPGWGKVRRSRIRGSRAAANHQNAYHAI